LREDSDIHQHLDREFDVEKTRDRFPPYYGPEWERKISDPGHPNFWKYGVANCVFLDYVKNKDAILDIGCGTGGSTMYLAENCNANAIVGVDIVRTMIQTAKEKEHAKACRHRVDFVLCDARRLPFKGSCFEAVVSRGDVLPWLVPQDKAVEEFHRIMKTGAVIVVEIDNRGKEMRPRTTYGHFEKNRQGELVYVLSRIDENRDHVSIYYILNMNADLAKEVTNTKEFLETGYYPSKEYSIEEIERETVEVRQGLPTHWPTQSDIRELFEACGLENIEVFGDGFFMKLLLEADEETASFLKRHPDMFFRIEKKLLPFVAPDKAPTLIVKASKSNNCIFL